MYNDVIKGKEPSQIAQMALQSLSPIAQDGNDLDLIEYFEATRAAVEEALANRVRQEQESVERSQKRIEFINSELKNKIIR